MLPLFQEYDPVAPKSCSFQAQYILPLPRSSQSAPGRAAGFFVGTEVWLQGRSVYAAAVVAVSAHKPVLSVVS